MGITVLNRLNYNTILLNALNFLIGLGGEGKVKNENRFLFSTELIIGENVLEKIPQEIILLNYQKVLITTDPGIRRVGLVDRIVSCLKKAGISPIIFDQVEENPSIETVQACTELAIKERANLIIGVGGGSAIDVGKAVGIMVTNPGTLSDYEGANKVKNQSIPLIAVPTTAGTGSEVSASTVITDKFNKRKISIRSPLNIPKIAFLDPIVVSALPPQVAAATGLDALTHAIEAYTSTQASLLTDMYAISAISFIGKNLRAFVANSQNLEAAMKMLIGSTMAGVAFTNARLGNVHALATPVSGYFNVPHGVANAILLTPVIEFNRIACQEKYAQIAVALGENIKGDTLWEASTKAVNAVRQLCKDVGIPTKLTEVGVDTSLIPEMVNDAIKSGVHLTNPRRTSAEDMEKLYQSIC